MKIAKFIHVLNNRTFFLILHGFLLAIALIPYYTGSYLILGEEGDYAKDFTYG